MRAHQSVMPTNAAVHGPTATGTNRNWPTSRSESSHLHGHGVLKVRCARGSPGDSWRFMVTGINRLSSLSTDHKNLVTISSGDWSHLVKLDDIQLPKLVIRN